MAVFKLRVDGIEDVQKRLKGLPPKVGKKIVRKAMRPAMKIVQEKAKASAPVETGALQKAIKVRAAKRSRKYFGIDVRIGEGDFKGDQFYGAFQEYGWSNAPPKGYMRRAFDEASDEAKAKALAELNRLIDEAVKTAA